MINGKVSSTFSTDWNWNRSKLDVTLSRHAEPQARRAYIIYGYRFALHRHRDARRRPSPLLSIRPCCFPRYVTALPSLLPSFLPSVRVPSFLASSSAVAKRRFCSFLLSVLPRRRDAPLPPWYTASVRPSLRLSRLALSRPPSPWRCLSPSAAAGVNWWRRERWYYDNTDSVMNTATATRREEKKAAKKDRRREGGREEEECARSLSDTCRIPREPL